MAFRDDQGGGFQPREPKTMHEGNWQCGTCGAKIDKLPFKPKEERLKDLKCLKCWKESRPPRDRF